MFDSTKIFLPKEDIRDSGYFDRVPIILSNLSYTTKENGMEYLSGTLENLNISVGKTGISINGSLNKYYHTDNFQKINRQQVELCINKLSDVLGLYVDDGIVQRVDISHNFLMNEPVENYYNFLGSLSHYKKMIQPSSVYYQNKKKTLLFYDKVKEGQYRKQDLPIHWIGRYYLRYEMRYMTRFASQLNKSIIFAKDLYNEDFYMTMIDNWANEYFKINKNKIFRPMEKQLTSKQGYDYLMSALIEELGANKAYDIIDTMKHNFAPKEYTRIKQKLKSLNGLTEQSHLIEELDQKILRVKEFYR